ncbi:MAG: trypsin-like peptidase domain-containing protein [Anaerolineae bacterium]|nr:trypsin-like peptidase domain-containing protein [Anaerolineae bacterium]
MSGKSRKWQNLILVSLVVLFVGLGCSLSNVLPLNLLPSPEIVSPTATTAAPLVTPLPSSRDLETTNALESQIIAVYEAVSPAVVNITSRSYTYDMFMRAVPQEGTGSGFVYDTQGHIVTNYHVIENAEELLVTLANGQVYEAQIVGTDPSNDLAVIRIDAGADLPAPVVLGDSDQLRVGQFVLAIGNPFGLEQTLTTGVVSALGRVIESPDGRFIGEAIQTDAAINPGNSGGPLLDLEGRGIGVNSQIISTSGTSSGVGFAVSVNTVRRVVPELIARGYYPHPWLGTEMLTLTPATAKVLREAGMNVPVDSGLLVIETVPGGPADKAGIRGGDRVVRIGRYRVPLGGDIITAVNGQAVEDFQDLTVYLETETVVGDTVELTIIRDGAEQTVSVTLEERPQ